MEAFDRAAAPDLGGCCAVMKIMPIVCGDASTSVIDNCHGRFVATDIKYILLLNYNNDK